jgi:hypothetical protein
MAYLFIDKIDLSATFPDFINEEFQKNTKNSDLSFFYAEKWSFLANSMQL